MIGPDDAAKVARVAAESLKGASANPSSFERLPDSFWGYFARGHDSKGTFGVFVAYSEDAADVDALISSYEEWAKKKVSKK